MISIRINRQVIALSAAVFLSAATIAGAQSQPGMQQQQSMPSQQQPQMTPNATSGSDSSTNQMQDINDHDFVKKALEGGDTEVQLGQLAQQKSQSDDVKQFGQKMVADHTALGDKLMKPIAQQMGVKEPKGPSKKDKELIAKLQGLSGDEFDQAYIQAMLKDHKQDLKDFKQEAEMTQNANVKSAATQGYGMISQHYQMIQQIAQSHNISPDGKTKSGV